MACPRPRVTARNGFAHAYYPANYKAWKTEAAKEISKMLPKSHVVIDYPVAMDITFNVKRPKKSKLFAPKPDVDNYQKSLFDAMTAAEVWTDDTLVVTVTARKRWADADGIDVSLLPEYIV